MHSLSPLLARSSHSRHGLVLGRQRAPGLPHESEPEAGVPAAAEPPRCHAGAFRREQPGSEIQDKKREWHFNPYPRKQQLHYCEGKIKANADFIRVDRLLRQGLNHFSHNSCPLLLQPVRVPTDAGHHSNIIYLNHFPGTGQSNKDLQGLVSKHFCVGLELRPLLGRPAWKEFVVIYFV